MLCNLALLKGKEGLALGRSYHLTKRTRMLPGRELTWHLHRAGVCRFTPACRGHGDESLTTETRCSHHPAGAQVLWGITRCPVFCSYPAGAKNLHSGDGEAGLWSYCGADTQVHKHHHGHALHFPGAEAAVLRGTGSPYAQLSLCASMS